MRRRLATLVILSLSALGVGFIYSLPQPEPVIAVTNTLKTGSTVILNGRKITLPWSQWSENNSVRIGLSDTGAMRSLGLQLLDTSNPSLQPVSWFSSDTPITLKAKFINPYRYLDVTEMLAQAGIQVEVKDNSLVMQLPLSQITQIRSAEQTWGKRIVLDLERPTFWQVSQSKEEGLVTVEGLANPLLLSQWQPTKKPDPQAGNLDEDDLGSANGANADTPLLSLESKGTTTQVKVKLPTAQGLQLSSLHNPPRLVIDIRPDYVPPRQIVWQKGITWKQLGVSLGEEQFPVHILEIDPRLAKFSLKPLLSRQGTLIGIEPLLKISREQQPLAAINGGFFDRQSQLPLGAICRDGRWLSSPILNRGAIAWSSQNQWLIGRLGWQETLEVQGNSYPLASLNSGYLEKGMARYTRDWGEKYTTLTDQEVLLTVENQQVSRQVVASQAGKDTLAIPSNGYLLVIRKQAYPPLGVGTEVTVSTSTAPPEWGNYANILGAGPLLVQNGEIVLDAASEKFSPAFQTQKASRSAIALTPQGTILMITLHQRLGGSGATLAEFGQIVKSLGVKDALNLDGGSSTSLALGGQLVDRFPATAARIHNGLGIFWLGE